MRFSNKVHVNFDYNHRLHSKYFSTAQPAKYSYNSSSFSILIEMQSSIISNWGNLYKSLKFYTLESPVFFTIFYDKKRISQWLICANWCCNRYRNIQCLPDNTLHQIDKNTNFGLKFIALNVTQQFVTRGQLLNFRINEKYLVFRPKLAQFESSTKF